MLAHDMMPSKRLALLKQRAHLIYLFSFIKFAEDYNGGSYSRTLTPDASREMKEILHSIDSIQHALRRIRELLDQHQEWIYSGTDGKTSSSVHRSELDLRIEYQRLMLSCVSDEGAAIWRISAWEWTGEKLLFDATRRMGALRATLELVPRASASSIAALVNATRRARCQALAQLASERCPGSQILSTRLSASARRGQPGRDARILLSVRRESLAVTGEVAEGDLRGADAFLSSALIWFSRISEKARPPYVKKLWLIAGRESIEPLSQRLALLRDDLRRLIALYEIDAEWQSLAPVPVLERNDLWLNPPQRLPRTIETGISESAAHIVALAPGAIDLVRARHGETLRFHGLAFARVRRVMNHEGVWFGIEGAGRRLLNEETWRDWDKLLRDLQEHRHASAGDRQHALYRAAPEAWLESMLRRDITRLDPGMRLAPLYAQFRASSNAAGVARPIDLLALRRDGRLVVIELKVSEDREHVLQGADYWRRVEAHRRCGNIERARLFGDAVIEDVPPLVYLVAPLLRFHRAFDTLAHGIAPDIQIYRFDLNEDWRAGVRVMRRAGIAP